MTRIMHQALAAIAVERSAAEKFCRMTGGWPGIRVRHPNKRRGERLKITHRTLCALERRGFLLSLQRAASITGTPMARWHITEAGIRAAHDSETRGSLRER